MKIIWSPQAEARLQEIEDFIAQDSPENAIQFIRQIIQRAMSLILFPHSGRILPEKEMSEFREILEGNYRIVYRVRKNHIEIVTVFEGHRQFPVEDLKPAK
jgi:addiction module RelE/StbE family toxin